MAAQKFTNFDKFLKMLTAMTAVTMQSNKGVSSKVKETKVLLEPPDREN